MEIFKKFLSRRLVVIATFGVAVPLLFKASGIDGQICLASIALGAAYIGQRAVKG